MRCKWTLVDSESNCKVIIVLICRILEHLIVFLPSFIVASFWSNMNFWRLLVFVLMAFHCTVFLMFDMVWGVREMSLSKWLVLFFAWGNLSASEAVNQSFYFLLYTLHFMTCQVSIWHTAPKMTVVENFNFCSLFYFWVKAILLLR